MLRPRRALAIGAIALLLSNVPYLIASGLAEPPYSFSGFLLNPIDGHSYLAKMRQGRSGPLEFRLPYAPEPGGGSLLFVYYLVLGRLSAVIGLDPMAAYHAARLLGSVAMFGASYLFINTTVEGPRRQLGAYALATLGSGIGWLAAPFGLTALDLQVPEAIPLLTSYVNPHFPAAAALILFSVAAVLTNLPAGWIYLASFGLALVQPFNSVVLGATMACWLLVELRLAGRNPSALRPGPSRPDATPPPWRGVGAFALGAAPVLAYDFGAVRVHPILSEWAAQNLTPSPSLLETVLGYGLLIPLAVLGIRAARPQARREARLLVLWVLVNGLLLYAPVPLQRRLTLGLFFPLAALAGYGLDRLAGSARRVGLVLAGCLALSFPSHGLVIAAGLSSVANTDPALLRHEDEVKLYQALEQRLSGPELVLAGPTNGNRIPAYTQARVLYGHPFETPRAAQSLEAVLDLYRWSGAPESAIEVLNNAGIRYVVYSLEEQQLGKPDWIRTLRLVAEHGMARLYAVPGP